MPPTIRIDDEVYAWLQENARPFEDTPNTVLRRVAGLSAKFAVRSDAKDPTDTAADRRDTATNRQLATSARGRGRLGPDGRQMNEEWRVGARHALFSRDGTWYENLERFPGALFDKHGYVLFRTEEAYRSHPKIRIGKKTNIHGGISRLPEYVRKI